MRKHLLIKRTISAAAAFWLALTCLAPLPADAQATAEYQVKAAFLYNFAKFVEWPESAFANAEAPLTICVIGDDPFGSSLDALRDKTVKNRKIAVKRVSGVAQAGLCQVLFISTAEEDRMDEILVSLKGHATLVAGDAERFARRGGMIGFLMERNKVVFEINENAAKKAGLQISSQLLKLARTVY